MLWVVLGSIAMAVGVATSILAISELDAPTIGELAGILLALSAIGIAIYIAILQIRQTGTLHNMIHSQTEREKKRKRYFLIRIRSYTEHIKDKFEYLVTLIDKYEMNNDASTITQSGITGWDHIVSYSKGSLQEIEALGVVANDFDRIYDLIDSPYLSDKYTIVVDLSKFTIGQVIIASPYVSGLSGVKKLVRDHMAKLDMILESIDDELPKDEK